MRNPSLDAIVSSGLCSGCGACVYAAGGEKVQMYLDASGFLRPRSIVLLEPKDQERVATVCPGVGLTHTRQPEAGAQYHPIWGPIKDCWTGFATDPLVRHEGSSGGMISALLIYLLESGEIDCALHTRVSETNPIDNMGVLSKTRADVIAAAGSRYAPSAPVAKLQEAIACGGRFAFVGKPCDVAAVRKILNVEPELRERIPYLLSFMCAGTPSMKGTEEIIDRFGLTGTPLRLYRYRGNGWPGLNRVETVDGRQAEMNYNTAWGEILSRYLQPRCKICADGTGEFADIVGADAWYVKDGFPDFSEREGRSLVIVRTAKGQGLLDRARTAGFVKTEPFSLEDLPAIQPYQMKRKQELRARLLALWIAGKSVPNYSGLGLVQASKSAGLKANFKSFAGMLTRIVQGRI